MSQQLTALISQVQSLQKNIFQELAEPIQTLVDMVHAGEIESFYTNFFVVRPLEKANHSKIHIKINSLHTGYLGTGLLEPETYIEPNLLKSISAEGFDKIVHLNTQLNAINDYLSTSIPVDTGLYAFSLKRLHNGSESNPNSFDVNDWPMLPAFLEDYVNLHGTPQQTITPVKKVKP